MTQRFCFNCKAWWGTPDSVLRPQCPTCPPGKGKSMPSSPKAPPPKKPPLDSSKVWQCTSCEKFERPFTDAGKDEVVKHFTTCVVVPRDIVADIRRISVRALHGEGGAP